jgi:hypothetical protein
MIMIYKTRAANIREWQSKFAYFPQDIGPNQKVWWGRYEERWNGMNYVRRLPGSSFEYVVPTVAYD